jgi:hypothetical protein
MKLKSGENLQHIFNMMFTTLMTRHRQESS